MIRLWAALACLLLPSPVPASAAPGAAVLALHGTGTVSPGYPVTGCIANESLTFNGLTTLASDTMTSLFNVMFNGGSDICETLMTGHGSATVIGNDNFDVDHEDVLLGSVTYSRSGTTLFLTGQLSIYGTLYDLVATVCHFVFTSVSPSTSYVMTCGGVLTHA